MNTDENQKIWIEKVHENLILRGRSENTYNNYKCALNSFFKYYSKETRIDNLKENDIINFLNYKYIIPNRSKNSYNVSIAAIRLLYLVCFETALNKILLPTSKTINRIPTILPKDKFLEIINNESNIKHKCWLILAFCSGLRVEEIANLKIKNIDSKNHTLKVLGKGNKERYTILPDVTIKLLRIYCKRKNIKSGYLFPGTNGKKVMNSNTIINYFSVIKEDYNLDERITFHSLRHSFATYYLLNNGSLLTLQSMLGHTNLNTTTIYLHLSQDFNNLEGIKYA